MIETYQQAAALEPAEPQEASFATVGAVHADGVTLIFDGQEEATAKHYKVNAFVVFKAGDRVRIIKDSGTYVVEYPVGNPKTAFAADSADNAAKLNSKAESALSVGDSEKLGGKTEGNLDVARAARIKNPYNQSANYDIYLYASASNVLYFKLGPSGTYYKLANA